MKATTTNTLTRSSQGASSETSMEGRHGGGIPLPGCTGRRRALTVHTEGGAEPDNEDGGRHQLQSNTVSSDWIPGLGERRRRIQVTIRRRIYSGWDQCWPIPSND